MKNFYETYKKLKDEGQAFLKEGGPLCWAHHLHGGVDFTNPYLRIGKGFVFSKNGDIVTRGFPKFFNYKQFSYGEKDSEFPASFVEEYTEGFTEGKIYKAYEKLDGSLILISELNGKLFVTSARTSTKSIPKAARRLLESKGHTHLADALKNKGFTLAFEYIAPENKIIIDYSEPDLILLGIIVNETGEVIPPEKLHQFIDYDKSFTIPTIKYTTLSDILKEKKENKSIEGYVVKNDYGHMVKFKTDFWFTEKMTVTDLFFGHNITKRKIENLLDLYLEDSLDDILALKNQKYPHITYVDDIIKEIHRIVKEVNNLETSSKDNRELSEVDFGHLAYYKRVGKTERFRRGILKILFDIFLKD